MEKKVYALNVGYFYNISLMIFLLLIYLITYFILSIFQIHYFIIDFSLFILFGCKCRLLNTINIRYI